MDLDFDLLGDPIPEGWGKRGRPPHVPNDEKRNKVMMLMAMGWPDERIGNALGITAKTLRKHYFPQLKARDHARDRVEGARMSALWAAVQSGSVPAIKYLGEVFARLDLARTAREYEDGPRPKEVDLGKKAAAAVSATTAGLGTDWGDDLLAGVTERKH